MKNLKKTFLYLPLFALLTSCYEDGEVFTGSPLDNNNIQIATIEGIVSTDVTSALTDQKLPFTVTLPRTFADTVRVEASSFNNGGGRRRGYAIVPPGDTVGTGTILSAGGATFNATCTLSLTAIELFSNEFGKHYLLKSNVINLSTGNTTIPEDDANRLQIKFTWLNASSTTNNLRLVIDRPDPVVDASPNLTVSSRFHNISNVDAASPNSNGTSNVAGDYILQFTATRLVSTPLPTNMFYRCILQYPEGKTEVYEGFYNNLFANDPATPSVNEESPLLPFLKITKSVSTAGVVSFSALAL